MHPQVGGPQSRDWDEVPFFLCLLFILGLSQLLSQPQAGPRSVPSTGGPPGNLNIRFSPTLVGLDCHAIFVFGPKRLLFRPVMRRQGSAGIVSVLLPWLLLISSDVEANPGPTRHCN